MARSSSAPATAAASRSTRSQGFDNGGGDTSRPRSQRGAAIVTALLVVALSAILVSGLLWRQQIQVRRLENERLRDQAAWVVRGAVNWTRLVLRNAADVSNIDYLGGAWAVPIAPTRLSDLIGSAGDGGGDSASGIGAALVSGSIEDAQARFNLRNLVWAPPPGALQVDPAQTRHFQRLLQLVGLDTQLADVTAQRLRAALQNQPTRFQTAPGSASAIAGGVAVQPTDGGAFSAQPGLADDQDDNEDRPLPPLDVDWLLDVPGFTAAMVERLRPFVTVLPLPTLVNVNTASPEVLAAMIPGLNIGQAQTLVSGRDRAWFVNIGDLSNRIGGGSSQAPQPDSSELDIHSNFFVLHGEVRYERAVLRRDTLIFRDNLTHATRIVSVRDIE
ncbi:type II secretion system minor pseudopilin GspK [Burkholderia sp. L27(2015)]|uniref:type II secretion system minor pseudopilin GspK n=1 Tax=Burkholderia sp. L27(2015) TaxID=1641858 RepID=UPI00131AFC9E|nr:type II secretion system minor pseudopilin GspK [Burkholderia sp. L27(2015)]